MILWFSSEGFVCLQWKWNMQCACLWWPHLIFYTLFFMYADHTWAQHPHNVFQVVLLFIGAVVRKNRWITLRFPQCSNYQPHRKKTRVPSFIKSNRATWKQIESSPCCKRPVRIFCPVLDRMAQWKRGLKGINLKVDGVIFQLALHCAINIMFQVTFTFTKLIFYCNNIFRVMVRKRSWFGSSFSLRTITMWFRWRHDRQHALKNTDCLKEVGKEQPSPTIRSWKSDRVGGADDCLQRWCFLYLFEWIEQLLINSYKQRFTTIWFFLLHYSRQQTSTPKILKVKTVLATAIKISKAMKRKGISPDSLMKLLKFVSCWVRRNFMKPCLWQIPIIIWDFLWILQMWMSANKQSMYNSDLPIFQG